LDSSKSQLSLQLAKGLLILPYCCLCWSGPPETADFLEFTSPPLNASLLGQGPQNKKRAGLDQIASAGFQGSLHTCWAPSNSEIFPWGSSFPLVPLTECLICNNAQLNSSLCQHCYSNCHFNSLTYQDLSLSFPQDGGPLNPFHIAKSQQNNPRVLRL
jgi:hypothetical protein